MYTNTFDFTGKVALIAGGYGGLGAEASRAFAQLGATVLVVGRNKEKAEALASEINQAGQTAEGIGCDCMNEEEVILMVEAIAAKYGKIDILVNYLGGNCRQPAEKYELVNWNRIMDLNLTSSMLLCRESGKVMIKQKAGKIILLGSVRSELGLEADYTAYCAAKGAVKMYAKCLAAEWAKYNINVNVVAPTFVETLQVADMLSDVTVRTKLLSRIPLGRFASEADVTHAVLFFSSSASDFITGQLLLVDGGVTSRQ
jgi:gluconate 5-dehydrogenase